MKRPRKGVTSRQKSTTFQSMFAVETEPSFAVNRRPTYAAVPAADPVFTAYTASMSSVTFTAWLSPVSEDVTYSGTVPLYGIICANNPVNFVDPFGLCAESGDAFTDMYRNSLMRNPLSPYNVIWRHLGNPAIDVGQTQPGTTFSYLGGTVAPNVQGNITAGETLTGAYGAGLSSFLFVVAEGANVLDPAARARGQLLEDAAGSFSANYAGMGKAWREHPVHTTALTVGTFTPIMPIALGVNWAADRLGQWSGGGGLHLSW
jgi:hypothetical protein